MQWTLLVLALVALAGALVAWRTGRDKRVSAGLGGLFVLLAAVAAWQFSTRDPGQGVVAESARAFNTFPGMATAPPGGAAAGSLPELAERLAARLESSPGDAAGWSLLAATYRQLGRDEDAARAEQRALEAGGDPAMLAEQHNAMMQMSRSAAGTSMLESVTQGPSANAPYVAEGQRLRVERRFAEAAAAFRKAVEVDPTDADSWADLADAAAIAAGRDLTAGQEAIERALALDPRHRKALWLRASLELQEGRYKEAAATWRTLADLVAPDSPDARVIAANIAEADTLALGQGKEG